MDKLIKKANKLRNKAFKLNKAGKMDEAYAALREALKLEAEAYGTVVRSL